MSLTTTSVFPKELEKSLVNKYRCDLLHKKIPIYDEKTNRIFHYCKECSEKKINEKENK
jgi:hypothetical protein